MVSMANAEYDSQYREMRQRAESEARSRNGRILHLRNKVVLLFPGDELKTIRNLIYQSFDVPQFGEHHNEGLLMDTHLVSILAVLDQLKNEQVDSKVPKAAKEILVNSAKQHFEALERYALLHDLSKPDCLKLKFKSGLNHELDWSKYCAMTDASERSDPLKLLDFFTSRGISSISYYHEVPPKKHGEEAAKILAPMLSEIAIPKVTLKAIELHEIAYQFASISAANFRKHFSGLNSDERAWALTASYTDTMGSYTKELRPDLSNFCALAQSMINFELIEELELLIKKFPNFAESLDPKKIGQFVRNLLELPEAIVATPEELFQRVKIECVQSQYDIAILSRGLADLIDRRIISNEEREQIIGAIDPTSRKLIQSKWTTIRATLKERNRFLAPIIDEACIN